MSAEKTKRHGSSSGLLLLVLSILSFAGAASAADFIGGTNILIPAGQAINDDLYMGGAAIGIDGTVNGDVIAGAGNIRVSGRVADDLMVAGGSIIIGGDIGDSIRAAGGAIAINSNVGSDILAAGGTVSIAGNAGRDVLVGAGSIELTGRIGGNLSASGDTVVLGGVVDGNANITAESLELMPGAEIKGDLVYTSRNKAKIAEGARLHGVARQIIPTKPERRSEELPLKEDIYSFMRFFIVGALVVHFAPKLSENIADSIVRAPLKSSIIGFAVLVTVPFVAVLLMVTILGISLAVLGILAYAVAIYVSGVFISFAIGRKALERAGAYAKEDRSRMLALFIGLVVLTLIQKIPGIGWFVSFVTIAVGLEAIIAAAMKREPVEEKRRTRKK